MKAAIFKKANVIEVDELPVPETPPGMVRVKTLACGVCGTDLHIYKGENPLARPPVALGHEIVAELEECGEGVEGPAVGSKVALDPLWPCGRCEYCKRGAVNHCPAGVLTSMAATLSGRSGDGQDKLLTPVAALR